MKPEYFDSAKHPYFIRILKDRLTTKNYSGLIGNVRSDFPVPYDSQYKLYYYELKIERGDEITIGLAIESSPDDKLLGSFVGSVGYRSDSKLFSPDRPSGVDFGESFTDGDIVGCGIFLDSQTVFFTRNGKHIGKVNTSFFNISSTIFPCVSLRGIGGQVSVNFGRAPFIYDSTKPLRDLEKEFDDRISKVQISPCLVRALVRDYLLFNAYSETLQALDAATGFLDTSVARAAVATDEPATALATTTTTAHDKNFSDFSAVEGGSGMSGDVFGGERFEDYEEAEGLESTADDDGEEEGMEVDNTIDEGVHEDSVAGGGAAALHDHAHHPTSPSIAHGYRDLYDNIQGHQHDDECSESSGDGSNDDDLVHNVSADVDEEVKVERDRGRPDKTSIDCSNISLTSLLHDSLVPSPASVLQSTLTQRSLVRQLIRQRRLAEALEAADSLANPLDRHGEAWAILNCLEFIEKLRQGDVLAAVQKASQEMYQYLPFAVSTSPTVSDGEYLTGLLEDSSTMACVDSPTSEPSGSMTDQVKKRFRKSGSPKRGPSPASTITVGRSLASTRKSVAHLFATPPGALIPRVLGLLAWPNIKACPLMLELETKLPDMLSDAVNYELVQCCAIQSTRMKWDMGRRNQSLHHQHDTPKYLSALHLCFAQLICVQNELNTENRNSKSPMGFVKSDSIKDLSIPIGAIHVTWPTAI